MRASEGKEDSSLFSAHLAFLYPAPRVYHFPPRLCFSIRLDSFALREEECIGIYIGRAGGKHSVITISKSRFLMSSRGRNAAREPSDWLSLFAIPIVSREETIMRHEILYLRGSLFTSPALSFLYFSFSSLRAVSLPARLVVVFVYIRFRRCGTSNFSDFIRRFSRLYCAFIH